MGQRVKFYNSSSGAGHVVSGSWWTRLSRESSHCKMNKPGFECF